MSHLSCHFFIISFLIIALASPLPKGILIILFTLVDFFAILSVLSFPSIFTWAGIWSLRNLNKWDGSDTLSFCLFFIHTIFFLMYLIHFMSWLKSHIPNSIVVFFNVLPHESMDIIFQYHGVICCMTPSQHYGATASLFCKASVFFRFRLLKWSSKFNFSPS